MPSTFTAETEEAMSTAFPPLSEEGVDIYDPDLTVILSHKADLDGVASAVILAHLAARVGGGTVEVVMVHYAEIVEALKHWGPRAGRMLIADLSLRGEEMETLLADFSSENLVIFDHHASSRDLLSRLAIDGRAKVRFDDSGAKCAADLVYDYAKKLLPDLSNDYLYLKDLAHDRDLWVRAIPEADSLSDVVSELGGVLAYELLNDSVTRAKPEYYTLEMAAAAQMAKGNRDKSLKIALQTVQTSKMKEWFNRKQIVDEARDIELHVAYSVGDSSEVGDALYSKSPAGAFVALIDLDKWVLSFRASKSAITAMGFGVNQIAAAFGGGGHPYAAGAPGNPAFMVDLWEFQSRVLKVIVDIVLDYDVDDNSLSGEYVSQDRSDARIRIDTGNVCRVRA